MAGPNAPPPRTNGTPGNGGYSKLYSNKPTLGINVLILRYYDHLTSYDLTCIVLTYSNIFALVSSEYYSNKLKLSVHTKLTGGPQIKRYAYSIRICIHCKLSILGS